MLVRSRGLGVVLLAASLPLVAGFGICGGGGGPPPDPRGCDMPADASVITALELGSARGEFAPSARATSEAGGQGLAMLGYRVAVQATEPVTCIAITSGGGNLTVQPSGGWFVSDPIWEITRAPSIDVTVEAYGMRVERTMSATAPEGDASAADGGP
jgi:hypothetical protein